MGSEEHVDSIGSLWEPLAPQQTQRLTECTAKAFIRALDQYVDNGGAVSLDLEQSRIVTFVVEHPESLRSLLITCMDEERYGSSRAQRRAGGRV